MMLWLFILILNEVMLTFMSQFLSMKLATVNPELNVDIEQILSKDIIHSRGATGAILGFGPGMSSTHPYPHGIYQGTLPSIPSTTPKFPSLPQVSQVSLNQAIHSFPCYIINIRHLFTHAECVRQ
jgi:hypothetical protein